MKILSVNAGSSSLKFTLFELPEEKPLISGYFERIGLNNSFYTIKYNGEKYKTEIELINHQQAFEILVQELENYKIVESLDEIKGVGHRVVQGGDYYNKTTIIDDEVIGRIDELTSLAPLHNPAALIGIKASMEVIPNAVQTAVFDTAFHQTMPDYNYIYPVPYEWSIQYRIRKYGAHGTSHQYVSMEMNKILGREDTKLITCHIGSGASISAVVNGKCLNTSMGLTPNAGVMMGTRSGDIDATIIPYMLDKSPLPTKEIDRMLNKESGLLGISGISSDMRDIEVAINEGNERCELAVKMYVRRIADYIAKYYVEMGGCDAIVLTAGVCENAIFVRKRILNELKVLGVVLDDEANQSHGEVACITTSDSKIPVYVIPTDEELMIALDTYNLI